MTEQPLALLVDDNEFTRAIVSHTLRSWGYLVGTAGTAADAWRIADMRMPDVAIIDLDLGPGPDGIDVAIRLRQSNPGIGVVVLTNHRSPELVGGVDSRLPANCIYLVKPDLTTADQLRDAAARAVDQANAKSQTTIPEQQATLLRVSKTQADTLRMMARGLTNAQIAQARVCSIRAVELSIQRLYSALGISELDANARVSAVNMYNTSQVVVK